MPIKLFSRLLILFLAISFCLTGCGGGTTGTGGDGTTRVLGRVLNSNGDPIPDARVTLSETGASGVTDPNGNFSFDSEIAVPAVTFLVQSAKTEATAALSDLPDRPAQIEVELTLNEPRNELLIGSSEVTPRPTPTAPPSENPGSGVAESDVAVFFYVYFEGESLSRARLILTGEDGGSRRLRRSSPTSNFWQANFQMRRRGGQMILRTDGGDFSISIGAMGSRATSIQLATQLFPNAGESPLTPRFIKLLNFYMQPEGANPPTLTLTPAYTGDGTVAITPTPGTGQRPTPRPTPQPTPQIWSSVRANINFRSTPGVLHGATVRIPAGNYGPVNLSYGEVYATGQYYWVNVPLLANAPTIVIIEPTSGPSLQLTIQGFDPQLSYTNISADLLPVNAAGTPLSADAGLVITQLYSVPARFDDPQVGVAPPAPTTFLPTPTPVPSPRVEGVFNFDFSYNGTWLVGSRLVFSDPSIPPVSLPESPYSPGHFYAAITLPLVPANRDLTLETSQGNFNISISRIPNTAQNLWFSFYLQPEQRYADQTQNPPRWIEVSTIGAYPERGGMRIALSPTPPPG